MTTVVDASVVAKWVLDEEGSDRARALRNETGLIAPSQLVSEVANAFWKAVRRGDAAANDAASALRAIFGPLDAIVPNHDLLSRGLELALALQHPMYDCLYLGLAERERAPLITADERLLAAARKARVKAPRL